MNPNLAARPLDMRRKLPVPYVQAIRPDGAADFAAINGDRVLECAQQRLCGLCAQPLRARVAFLGGPLSAQSRTYSDPPMHPECATDALTLCPHIARPRVDRRAASVPTGIHAQTSMEKPNRWALYIARSYTYTVDPISSGGYAARFIAGPAVAVRYYTYRDGLLERERQ